MHMIHLMQCHIIITCFIKTQMGLTFLVLAYPDFRGKEAVKRAAVCLSCLLCDIRRC